MARILSVEDDEHIQRLIGKVLFREGYEMHYAWNGQEGYEKVLSIKPDLIILDLALPLMNGVEFLEKLQTVKETRHIPVIVVTAFGDEAHMLKRAVEVLGAQHYVRKPIDMPDLLRRVMAVLNLYSQKSVKKSQEVRKGALRADRQFLSLWINDRLVATLPQKEFDLLLALLKSRGPVAKDKLLETLGYASDQGDALKQVLHRLRASLGPDERERLRTTPQGYELLG